MRGQVPSMEAGACPSWRSSGDRCPLAGHDLQPGRGGRAGVWSGLGGCLEVRGFLKLLGLGLMAPSQAQGPLEVAFLPGVWA